MTADWQVFPSTEWNYALALDDKAPNNIDHPVFHVHERPVGDSPFTRKDPPVEITLSARKIPSWRAVDGAADPVPPSPIATAEREETITLIPYAAAKLRITSFPCCVPPKPTP